MIHNNDTCTATASTTNDATATSATTTTCSNAITLLPFTTTTPVLFGTLNQDIADAMYQSINVQLRKGLQALPILSDDQNTSSGKSSSSRHGVLHEYILKQYTTAVDLMELYNARNTFSLNMLQPVSRQRKVMELYETYLMHEGSTSSTCNVWNDADWECHHLDSTDDNVTAMEEDLDSSVSITVPTSLDQIPTSKDMEVISNEITMLNHTLQQLQLQRQSLRNEIATLQTLHNNYHNGNEENSMPREEVQRSTQLITDHVAQIIPVVQALRECHNTSQNLREHMHQIETQRSDGTGRENQHNHNNNMNDIVYPTRTNTNTKGKSKPPATTLLERYEQDPLRHMIATPQTVPVQVSGEENDDGSGVEVVVTNGSVLATVLTKIVS
jgi:hypothetical protein